MTTLSRRTLLGAVLATPALGQGVRPRVVVVGGGFAGATAARFLAEGGAAVTLVEPKRDYIACPMSNLVIAGLRPMEEQRFGYAALGAVGITVVQAEAEAVDAASRTVRLVGGATLPFDRAILAPGIALRFDAIPGYTEAAADSMPHAWQAGPQTALLRDRLAALEDGGTVVITVPDNPYRCPPGPYERASLIAGFLKERKKRSKLLLLDAKDSFSKQKLFQAAWAELYPNLEYVPLAAGGKLSAVDAAAGTVSTEFETYRPALANIIPPQRAGRVAAASGAADRTGWCPIDPVTFESRLLPGVHVLGDAAIMGAIPKSAFAANAAAKTCAAAVLDLLAGRVPAAPRLINTCYSLVAPGYGISIAGVYGPAASGFADIPGAGGTSPLDAPPSQRQAEAEYGHAWFGTITGEVFG